MGSERWALGTKLSVDPSGQAVAICSRENWVALHPLDAKGGAPGRVFADGGGGQGAWVLGRSMEGAVRDLCFVSPGGVAGEVAYLAVCVLPQGGEGMGCIRLLRAWWGAGSGVEVVVSLTPEAGPHALLTGVSSPVGGVLLVTDVEGARVSDVSGLLRERDREEGGGGGEGRLGGEWFALAPPAREGGLVTAHAWSAEREEDG